MTSETVRDRLTTWKEIAAFVGRDERTAKRWEATRGLPVRRFPGGRSTVYADRRELEEWLVAAPVEPASSDNGPPLAIAIASPPDQAIWRRLTTHWRLAALASGLVVLAIATTINHFAASERLSQPPPRYSRAVYLMSTRTRAGLEEAIDDFAQVTLEAPRFAPAYAGLASSYDLMPEFGAMSPAKAFAQAKAEAEQALALDPDLAEGERALAFAEFWGSHDVPAARRAFDLAIRLDPNDAMTHHWYANVLTMLGDEDAALAEFAASERLDPASTATRVDHANGLLAFGRADEATDLLHAIADAEPSYARTQSVLALVEDQRGDHAAALAAMERAAVLTGDTAEAAIARAGRIGLAQDGVRGMRAAMLERREALFATDGQSRYDLAVSVAPIDANRALGLLEAASQAGEPAIMGIRADRRLAILRGLPRFAALLARIGLPPVSN